jgi:hypothetical protein
MSHNSGSFFIGGFTMNEFLQNLLYAVITTSLPLIVGYGVSYLKAVRAEKLQQIDNKYAEKTITQVTDIIMDAVDTVSQTYVDSLKKEGTFNQDKQKEALNMAIEKAKELINIESENLIVEKYNDLDTFIRNTIEAYIRSTKPM